MQNQRLNPLKVVNNFYDAARNRRTKPTYGSAETENVVLFLKEKAKFIIMAKKMHPT
jgi:hypothetical protein